MEGKVDKGRSDYHCGGLGDKIDTPLNKGNKGVPPNMPGSKDPSGTFVSPADKGDKGIPPMGKRPTAPPTLD